MFFFFKQKTAYEISACLVGSEMCIRDRFFAFFSSIINKILDLAPPVIIGLAVDIVVKEQNSWIAGFGIKEVPAQLIFLAFASGIVWSGESSFEYLYSILWRNLAQLSQHKLRIKAYEHIPVSYTHLTLPTICSV